MNRALPPGDRGNRSQNSGRASRPSWAVPGPGGLFGGTQNPPERATPPGTSPAARERENRWDSGFERVDSFFALGLCGLERQAHFLANRSGQEPPHRVCLPSGRLGQILQSCAVRTTQEFQDPGRFAARAGAIGQLRRFRALWLLGVLLGRGGLDLALPGATQGFRGAVLGVLVASGFGAAAAWRACSSVFGVVIVYSPCAVITAVRIWITLFAHGSKRILQNPSKAMERR